MPHHIWGDGFDFNKLSYVIHRLAKLYKRLTNNSLVYKEKYGTIRYESIFLWIETDQEFEIFNKCLKHIIKKYPRLAGELISNWIPCMDDNYWKSFFAGILWVTCQEEWRWTLVNMD
jgi:hypothetical protein